VQQAQRRPKGAAVCRCLPTRPRVLRLQPAASSVMVNSIQRCSFAIHIPLQTPLPKHTPRRLRITKQHEASCPPFEGGGAAADVQVCADVVVVREDLLGCGGAWEQAKGAS